MDEEARIDPSILRDLFDQGFMGMEIPEDLGGSGLSFTAACLAIEELARVDPSVAVVADIQNTLINNAIRFWASPQLQQKWLPLLASGRCLSAFCLSEANAGSDAFSMTTTATASSDGSYHTLRGNKLWISNAREARLLLVFATVDPSAGYKGITAFLVDRDEYDSGGDNNNNNNNNENQNSEIPALPFADGTNPSILKLVDNPRIDPSIRDFFEASGGSTPATTPYYLATICMTDSQCSWDLTPEEIAEFHLSPNDKPSTVRTVLLVLNRNFETLEEATIHARIDAFYGGRRNRRPPKPENQLKTFALDDARLFTHKGQIWVSYREGKLFGYEKQVLNQLHFDRVNDTEKTSDANGAEHSTKTLRATNAVSSGTGKQRRQQQQQQQLTVTFLASEVETLCCGRNMALIDNVHTNQLQALTWVDPVTVVDVDVHKTDEQLDGAAAAAESSAHRRRLSEAKNKKKSHMHGTNGFMVHLPSDGEYLGIGHFHRPNDRNKNEYARFGHHYTHAFFTISDKPPFRLKRLSPELVLPSHVHPEDAEVIQFWSGLELSSSKTLALVYGINDCEGAAIDLDLAVVENLLRDVPEGKEVVDFMMMPLHHR